MIMPNILTAAEAANFIRTEATDAVLLMLLPQVDSYIHQATGRDWAADATIHPAAKTAAGMLIAAWYDNPLAVGTSTEGAANPLLQLEVEALKYRKSVFYGSDGAGAISLEDAQVGDDVIKLVGVYGVSGTQTTKFESKISIAGEIQQTDVGDLSENIYVVILKSPADDVSA